MIDAFINLSMFLYSIFGCLLPVWLMICRRALAMDSVAMYSVAMDSELFNRVILLCLSVEQPTLITTQVCKVT